MRSRDGEHAREPVCHFLPHCTRRHTFHALVCSFKQALLLDCDMVLRKDPRYIFDDALFKERGNLLWGDIYGAGMFRDDVFDFLGTYWCP